MLVTHEQAFRSVMRRVKPLKSETIDLFQSSGKTLAHPIKADRDLPPTRLSAMDGYAVRIQDIQTDTTLLSIIGECAAGIKTDMMVRSGQTARIFTGAALPKGADSIAIVEQTVERGERVEIRGPVVRHAHVLNRAEIAKKGQTLLAAGVRIGPQQIGVCAAVGAAKIKVVTSPRISILCTGEELRTVYDAVGPHETRNSNGPMLEAVLHEMGFDCRYETLADQLKKIQKKIETRLQQSDVIVLTGGASKGRYDFVREAIERCGAKVHFHGVSMKPGKPQLFATMPDGRCLFGLPGNPLSAMTGMHELVLPALRRLSGRPANQCRPCIQAILTKPVTNKGDRLRMILGRLTIKNAQIFVQPIQSKNSADLAAGGQADGALLVPLDVDKLEKGEVVDFRPWSSLAW